MRDDNLNPWEWLAKVTAEGKQRTIDDATIPKRIHESSLKPGPLKGTEWTLLTFLPGQRRGPIRILSKWKCRCSCGNVVVVQSNNLTNGTSKSCGHDRSKGNAYGRKYNQEGG